MREHVHRHTAQFVGPAWWTVPVTCAIAALAAVALNPLTFGDVTATAQAAVPTCPSLAATPATSAAQAPEPVYEVEHIQAF